MNTEIDRIAENIKELLDLLDSVPATNELQIVLSSPLAKKIEKKFIVEANDLFKKQLLAEASKQLRENYRNLDDIVETRIKQVRNDCAHLYT